MREWILMFSFSMAMMMIGDDCHDNIDDNNDNIKKMKIIMLLKK